MYNVTIRKTGFDIQDARIEKPEVIYALLFIATGSRPKSKAYALEAKKYGYCKHQTGNTSIEIRYCNEGVTDAEDKAV